ncbi:MAG: hypothetical protein PHR77_02125 [Kiritimatiellae bacterium]|nr:hypothetical protein [Kiritimatiellia bacterium]MDD5521846.1 hypothetical protein [Kiritimatiellia bacterium]
MQKFAGFLVVQYVLISVVLAAEPQVTVKGLKGRIEGGKAMATFSLSVSSGYLAEFMKQESGVSRFVDDTGTDLGSKPVGKKSDYITMPYFSGFSTSFGDDMERRVHTVDFTSIVKPSPNAKSFELTGELRLKHADQEQTNEVKNVAISEGATFSIGQQQGKIVKVMKKTNGLEFDVQFENTPEDFEFRDIEMFDASGNEIRMSSTRTKSNFGDGPAFCKWIFYGIDGNPASVTLKCKRWIGLKEIRAPYSIKVPVGSGSGEGPQNIVASVVNVQPEKPEKPMIQPVPETKIPVIAPQVEAAGWPLLKVSGIVGKGQDGSVFINGKILSVGESIDEVKIESISNGSVILKYQGTTKKLRSGQSTQ